MWHACCRRPGVDVDLHGASRIKDDVVRSRIGASALFAHDTAFDEHHDGAVDSLFVQAISSGYGKVPTLVEGLTVSRFHVVHHLACTALLCESGAFNADQDEDSNCQSAHDVYSLRSATQILRRLN